jgi:hypothetical protein
MEMFAWFALGMALVLFAMIFGPVLGLEAWFA